MKTDIAHRPSPSANFLLLLIVFLFSTGACGITESPAAELSSTNGHFRVRISSAVHPMPINQMHAWTLQLSDTASQPVSSAQIEVAGRMPTHDHGLPTAPRASRTAEAGEYLIEGLRFHMPGQWELTLTISDGSIRDTLVVPLQL